LVARTKASLAASEVLCSFDEALALELQAQEWSMARPEFAEGVRRIRTALASRAAEPGDRVSKPEERVQG
jgi:enoyl-CoA hydratase